MGASRQGRAVSPPPEPAALSTALRSWLARRFGGQVHDADPPGIATGGYDYSTYLLAFRGTELPPDWIAPLVARVPSDPRRHPMLEREARLQGWCAQQGYPAPKVLAVLGPGETVDLPVEIMQRVPGVTMAASMLSAPWRTPRLVDRLAAMQASLHTLPIPPWADQAAPDWSVAERRLHLVRHVLSLAPDPALAGGLARVEPLLPRLAHSAPAVCHGDLHPENILVAGPDAHAIDWTDAGIGDRHADVSRTALLFRVAAVVAPRPIERAATKLTAPVLARRFLSAYRRRLPVDPARLDLWTPLHLLHFWAAASANESGLLGSTATGDRYPLGLGDWMRRQFEWAMSVVR